MDPEQYKLVRELYDELADQPIEQARRDLETRDVPTSVRTTVEELLADDSGLEALEDSLITEVGRRLVDSAELRYEQVMAEADASDATAPAEPEASSAPETNAGRRRGWRFWRRR